MVAAGRPSLGPTAPFAVPAVEELLRAPLFVPEMAGAEHDTASASLSDALRSAA
ncbi:MAG: hypothetical protein HY928_01780, partial [Elusimicrobia bacterium]|nr:hypothetical protein [Elusimicrobiota bacterium]